MRIESSLVSQFILRALDKNQLSLAFMESSHARLADAFTGPASCAVQEYRGFFAIGALVIAAGALFLALVASTVAQPLIFTLLAVLAVFGIFFLFAFSAGHIQFAKPVADDALSSTISDRHVDAMMLATDEGKTVWANRRMTSLIGKDMTGYLHIMQAALGGTPQVTEAMFRLSRAIEHGTARAEELEVHLANEAFGDSRGVTHLRVSVAPFIAPINPATPAPINLVLWSISNISAPRARQARYTQNLRASLNQYETMPIGVMTANTGSTVTHMNETLCRWLGYDSAAQVREDALKLTDVISSDSAELVRSIATRADETPTSIDLDLTCKDATLLPARVICHRAPTESADDTRGELVITALNRTWEDWEERKDVADSSDTKGVHFARFFRSAPFGIATVHKDGRVANTNAAFSRMIVDGTKCIGQLAADVLSKTADAETSAQIANGIEAVLSGRGKVLPIDIEAGKNREFARRIYMSPQNLAKNAPEAAILYVIDVTEQKALEAKYAQSQKMDAVGKLAGFVAHDFNNMLTAIIGFSDFLLQTHRPTDAAYSDIINIKSSANRAAGLVGKLLALARQQTLLAEPLQLGEVMTDLAPLLKRSIGERIELKLSTGRDLWHVKTDKLQLEQAIINLAVNARDAMPDGGRLTIRTRNITERESQRVSDVEITSGEYVLIEITDTGTGIPPDTLTKIFDPFFTTKAAGQGTGLGLATVYGIVKQSGGYIIPKSEVGDGTTFNIYLPRYHLEAKDQAAMVEKIEAKTKVADADLTGSGRVLLVEDEDVVRSFAVRALTRQGYDVLEADDGNAALEKLKDSGPVDIVISDVVMPGMDGPTMLKEMRKTHPDLKIIFISGYPNEAFQQALGHETFAFLPKPFSLPQLAAKVKEELSS